MPRPATAPGAAAAAQGRSSLGPRPAGFRRSWPPPSGGGGQLRRWPHGGSLSPSGGGFFVGEPPPRCASGLRRGRRRVSFRPRQHLCHRPAGKEREAPESYLSPSAAAAAADGKSGSFPPEGADGHGRGAQAALYGLAPGAPVPGLPRLLALSEEPPPPTAHAHLLPPPPDRKQQSSEPGQFLQPPWTPDSEELVGWVSVGKLSEGLLGLEGGKGCGPRRYQQGERERALGQHSELPVPRPHRGSFALKGLPNPSIWCNML